MSILPVTNKEKLYSLFSRDYSLFGYHIGDLDDFFFNNCKWYGYFEEKILKEIILLFLQFETPSLLLFGFSMRISEMVDNLNQLFPKKFFCHYLKDYESSLKKYFNLKPLGTHWKMNLVNQNIHNDTNRSNIKILTQDNKNMVKNFYDENYPNNYYDSYMLNTEKYVGYFIENNLVAIAGVHVYSPFYKVAVLGNIVTSKKFRNKGLAKITVKNLLAILSQDVKNISLNVQSTNLPAIKLYQSLGFKKTHEYEEGYFYRDELKTT